MCLIQSAMHGMSRHHTMNSSSLAIERIEIRRTSMFHFSHFFAIIESIHAIGIKNTMAR
jgi:hypothetical protein